MTEHDKRKGAPDKGHKTWFSPSEVNHSFPDFRSYFRMEYDQPWSMGKISLEWRCFSWPTNLMAQLFFGTKLSDLSGWFSRRCGSILKHLYPNFDIYIYNIFIHTHTLSNLDSDMPIWTNLSDDGDDDGIGDDHERDQEVDTELVPAVHPSVPNPRRRFRATAWIMLMESHEHIVNYMRLGSTLSHGKAMHSKPGTVPGFRLCHPMPSHVISGFIRALAHFYQPFFQQAADESLVLALNL